MNFRCPNGGHTFSGSLGEDGLTQCPECGQNIRAANEILGAVLSAPELQDEDVAQPESDADEDDD